MRKGVTFCPHVRRERALSQDVLIKCTDFMQKSNVVVSYKKKKKALKRSELLSSNIQISILNDKSDQAEMLNDLPPRFLSNASK